MMILDNVSMPSAADTGTADKSTNDGDTATPSVSVKIEKNTDSFKSLPVSSSVSSVNHNTFVVNLNPSPTNGNADGTKRKTNLLEIFSDNKGKSAPVVKALGRIVINRTLLKHPKSKEVRTIRRITSLNPPVNAPTSRSSVPIVLRGFQGKENGLNKKDDDISGNLANFMNFKLTGLVPSPVKTTHPNTNNTFRVSLNTPEINLSQANRNKSSSFSKLSVISSSNTNKPPIKKEDTDDDLTSLSWLTNNDKNLLKTIRSCNPDDVGISLSGDETDEDDEGHKSNAIFTAKSKVESGSQGGFSTRQYGQTSYNPNGKPPYSFSCLIFMAVEDSPRKMLPVKEIYSWVCKHFPYFETAPSGWKNSIRHNLSLNKCFKKVEQDKQNNDPGKGSLWCIDPAYRPNLIQALKRTPFYPYLYSNGIGQPLSLHNLANLLPGVRAGRVPLWSPNMPQPSESSCADPDVASAAMNLIGLMKGNDAIDRKSADSVQSTLKELAAEIFGKNQDDIAGSIPLVITSPAEDHTYSSASTFGMTADTTDNRCPTPDSEKSAPDAAYEFETCGTDLETDDNLSMGSLDEDECDLADSGFHGLKKPESSSKQRKRRATRSLSPAPKKGKRARTSHRNSTKSTQTPTKRGGLKVRFQKRGKSSQAVKNSRKRKITPQDGDGAFTSDADSGKDSPKIVRKSRQRTPAKKSITIPKQTKKNNATKPSSNRSSPYGTRSSSRKTRQSKRDQKGSVLQRAAARKMRQHSISADSDDEEIKLAAGSLLHLAGFRSSG